MMICWHRIAELVLFCMMWVWGFCMRGLTGLDFKKGRLVRRRPWGKCFGDDVIELVGWS